MKPVLLMVIDALSSRVVESALDRGRLPHFQALIEHGAMQSNCTSIFPSITHAATASLATGHYPSVHGVAGSHWYDAANDVPVYFSSDIWVILNRGLDRFFEDFAVRLNHQWLQTETIFHTVERSGLRAACLNHIIFRGDVRHRLDTPRILSLIPGISAAEEVYGPSNLCLGDFVQALPEKTVANLDVASDMLHRYGFEDAYTAEVLLQMAKDDTLPDFTLAYFPDNDDQSHRNGPSEALPTLEKLDGWLGELFMAYGGLPELLRRLCVVVTGDHAQSDILQEADRAAIGLDDILADFSLSVPGKPWRGDDDLMICPNLRAAQIYFRQATPERLERVVSTLLAECAIDQVLWKSNGMDERRAVFNVVGRDRGKLSFWSVHETEAMAADLHGNQWAWTGDLAVVDGEIIGDNELIFGQYPNAFERIQGGLQCPNSGHVWITAKPGYEFSIAETSIHNDGGSHGSLHADDSLVPLILAGAPAGIRLPQHPRIVDVAPLCLNILGL